MDISTLTDNRIIELIAGVVIAVLSFFFGHKKGKKDEKNNLGV